MNNANLSLTRIGTLLKREFVQGSKNFILIFAIVVPIVLTVVITALFGTLFVGKPRLGMADAGNSQMIALAKGMNAVIVKEYPDADTLRAAIERGRADIGLALPADFDAGLEGGEATTLTAYIWGESLLKNRAILVSAMSDWIRAIAGQESPVELTTVTIGEGESIPWDKRLMPFVIIMSIMMGGMMVPATSLVEEKQKRTLTALLSTPTTLGDVFAAKGLLGIILSVTMALISLALNRSFGTQPGLLIGLLILGAVMAAEIGMLFGAFVKDINTLFAVIKGTGILLYAPAIVYLFPDIPQWIGKIFPTYYMIQPVVEITQNGASWPDIATQVYILIALLAVLAGLLAFVVNKIDQRIE